MKLRTLSIFAAAAIVSLAACGDDADDAADDTIPSPDTGMVAPVTPDTTMAPPAPMPMDSMPMGDTMADTTARM